MRAFVGESQARNRYVFASELAKKNNLYNVEAIFLFTAKQEEAHAKVFYDFLESEAGKNITIDGTYPIDISDNVVDLLRSAEHNEFQEHDDVYKNFSKKAEEEGFLKIANTFNMIAEIEKTHGERFGKIADLIENNKLFISNIKCKWICLNCGYIFDGEKAPEKCPVCKHDKGYFLRLEFSPFANK